MKWEDVPQAVTELVKVAREPVLRARKKIGDQHPEAWVWYLPQYDAYMVKGASEDLGLPNEFHVLEVPHKTDEFRILVKKGAESEEDLKAPLIYRLLGLKPGLLPPVPAVSILTGAALGGLGSQVIAWPLGKLLKWLNKDWDDKKLRKTALKLGLLLGSSPGLLYWLFNIGAGKGVLKGLFTKGEFASVHPNWVKKGEADWVLKLRLPSPTTVRPIIDVDDTSKAIMSDPHADSETKAKMLGILNAASVSRNPFKERSPFVSPYDVMRVALGMGSGYASATVLGRLLERYAGAPPSVREKLEQAGIWAGAMKNIADMIFGR